MLLNVQNWPTEDDLKAVAAQDRVNVTTAVLLRTSVQAMRLARKQAENGTNPDDAMNFFSKAVDSLAATGRDIARRDPIRYPGWQEFLVSSPCFQTVRGTLNFLTLLIFNN